MKQFCLVIFLLSGWWGICKSQQNKDRNDEAKAGGIFHTNIPAHLYNIILSRPTNHSITASILANENMNGYIRYGLNPQNLNSKTNSVHFVKTEVTVLEIDKLEADKHYYYQLVYKTANAAKETASELNHFQTQRSANSSFTFTVQADSHLDENAGTGTYLQTLQNMAADSADFLVDLGDTWMTDKYRPDYKESLKQYIAQRYYFGSLCKSSSLFLTLGNHDGESGQALKKRETENMTNWATATRNKYYFNPAPNGFYSGNTEQENDTVVPENYYSWQWGNALFIVLDPFRYSAGNKDPWQRTLGERQYNWLQQTLQNSKAAFKFVFIHNLVGGVDLKGKGRGGAEASKYFEWGGQDSSGINRFAENRPGWKGPIHDLLTRYKVDIVFHGHDHFFAKQDRDGIVYQLVPQPGSLRYGNTNSAAEYGYNSGKILNSPGYLRITVEKTKAKIEFLQTSTDATHGNKELLYYYEIGK